MAGTAGAAPLALFIHNIVVVKVTERLPLLSNIGRPLVA